jgi:hypothetical protein
MTTSEGRGSVDKGPIRLLSRVGTILGASVRQCADGPFVLRRGEVADYVRLTGGYPYRAAARMGVEFVIGKRHDGCTNK